MALFLCTEAAANITGTSIPMDGTGGRRSKLRKLKIEAASMQLPIRNRVVVLTGAASGIGAALARSLAARGCGTGAD